MNPENPGYFRIGVIKLLWLGGVASGECDPFWAPYILHLDRLYPRVVSILAFKGNRFSRYINHVF